MRDFSYTRANQGAVLRAAGRVSDAIVISLKNTPHDYYPTFPDNPSIGHVGAHPQWAEFDTWGQFFGLGIFPAIVLDDMRKRFAHCAANGVSGVVARTDWEVIADGSVFDTLNLANLSGFGRLAQDPTVATAGSGGGRSLRCRSPPRSAAASTRTASRSARIRGPRDALQRRCSAPGR